MEASLIWLADTATEFVNISAVFLILMALLYFIQHQYCQLAQQRFGRKIIWVSAIIGTPIHELSHAILCLVFGHKVTELALFKPGQDGTLGYVMHSYQPRNPWHIIGNFFIGIAPIFGGVATIALATYFILPDGEQLLTQLNLSPFIHLNDISVSSLQALLAHLSTSLQQSAIQSPLMFSIWFYLITAISLHLSPSTVDIKGGMTGFLLFIVVMFLLKASQDYFEYSLFIANADLYSGWLSMLLIIAVLSSFVFAVIIFLFAKLIGRG